MAKTQVLPLADYPNGLTTYGPANLPGVVSAIGFTFQRCTSATPTIWPNASTTVAAYIELSDDGGATWRMCGGFKARGGIIKTKGEIEVAESTFSITLPGKGGRRIRGGMTIANAPLRTSVSVTY